MKHLQRHWSEGVSRRGFLRGTGIALALPWLDSLPLRAEDSGKRAAPKTSAKPPVRFGCVYFSNGVEPEHWWAKGSGAEMEFGPGPKPLAPFREDLVFLKGLFNEQAVKNRSAHLGRMPNLLSGAWVSLDQNDIRVGKTMDQVLAQKIGRQTALPSLVVGIEPTELRLEDGLSMIYGSSISWASATKPATKEIYPARVFDLITGGGKSRVSTAASSTRYSPMPGRSKQSWIPATATSWANTWIPFATSNTAWTARPRTIGWKVTSRRSPPPTWPGPKKTCRRMCPSICG